MKRISEAQSGVWLDVFCSSILGTVYRVTFLIHFSASEQRMRTNPFFNKSGYMSKLAIRLAGVSAWVSAAIIPIALLVDLFSPNGLALEYLLLVAPVALLPAILVLEYLYEEDWPQWSQHVTRIGLGGIGIVGLVLYLLRLFALKFEIPDLIYLGFVGLIALLSLWLIFSGFMGLYIHRLPFALPLLGIVAGVVWLLIVSQAVLAFFDPLLSEQTQRYLQGWNITTTIWLVSYLAYTIWLGY